MSNHPLALIKLEKFNKFVCDNLELKRIFVSDKYNFLQSFQDNIFFDILSSLNNSEKNTKDKERKVPNQSIFIVRFNQIFGIFFSFFSYLFLVISRWEILVFTADKNNYPTYQCDFRVANLYKYLFENKIRFFEIFHTIFRNEFISTAFRRHRPVIYLEAIDIFSKLYQPQIRDKNKFLDSIDFGRSGDDALFFKTLVCKYMRSIDGSMFRISFLSGLLKFTNVKILISPADTRNYNEIVAACKNNNIRTYGFQNGMISKYDIGYRDCCGFVKNIMKPEKMFVEAGYWKDELLRVGTYFNKEDIEVGGNLKSDYKKESFARKEIKYIKKNKTIKILIPYESAAPKGELIEYINKLLSDSNIEIIFKMRVDRVFDIQAREYGLKNNMKRLRFISDLKEASDFDIAAGTFSTFLHEMISELKPVALLKTSLDYGEGLVINGLADELDINNKNFFLKIKDIKNTDLGTLERRRERLFGNTVTLASTLDKILKL